MGLFLVSCNNGEQNKSAATDHSTHEHKTESYYTCSMHPQVREKEPGKCPICHMNLTKVDVEEEPQVKAQPIKEIWACEEDHSVTSESPTICPLDGQEMVKLSQPASGPIQKVNLKQGQIAHFDARVFEAQHMLMKKEIRLLGQVVQASQKESNIPLRVDGRIEKVFVKSEGESIRRGQPVVEIYSPTLISAGEEYVIAYKGAKKNSGNKDYKDLLRQSEERLTNWGVTSEQRERWANTGVVDQSIVVYAPTSGIVTKRFAVIGRYFKEGQSLFDLVDLSSVWVELDVYEVDSGMVENGQKLEMGFSAIPGLIKKGELDFVSPVIDPKTRTLKVRATIDNSGGELKLGMIVDARLDVELKGDRLVIPRTSVVDTGKRQIAWVKVGERSFESRLLNLGMIAGDYVEVISGLSLGDQVVERGNFLLDAQAQLFGSPEAHNH